MFENTFFCGEGLKSNAFKPQNFSADWIRNRFSLSGNKERR